MISKCIARDSTTYVDGEKVNNIIFLVLQVQLTRDKWLEPICTEGALRGSPRGHFAITFRSTIS